MEVANFESSEHANDTEPSLVYYPLAVISELMLMEFAKPEPSLKDLIRLIEMDADGVAPVAVLQRANSAGSGLRQPIVSVTQAVPMLGVRHLQRIAEELYGLSRSHLMTPSEPRRAA